jgi:hypothetical protein
MEEQRRKRGRPKRGVGKTSNYSLRLDANESYNFEMFCFEKGENKSDVLRNALKLYIEMKKYQ